MGTSLLGLVFNFFLIFGVAYTYPLFISIGNLIGVPMNALIDAEFRGEHLGANKICAFFMILVGFVILLIPVARLRRWERKLHCCCREHYTDTEYQQI